MLKHAMDVFLVRILKIEFPSAALMHSVAQCIAGCQHTLLRCKMLMQSYFSEAVREGTFFWLTLKIAIFVLRVVMGIAV